MDESHGMKEPLLVTRLGPWQVHITGPWHVMELAIILTSSLLWARKLVNQSCYKGV